MKYFFIVGCGRSGTTWLRMLLAQHQAVASPLETHLFDQYLSRLHERWEEERKTGSRVGLRAALTEAQFTNLCADFAHGVMQHIAESNPRARIVVEKTPGHVRYVPLILKLLPDAYFIHLVRDPRAVVSSLCAAGRSWGRSWALTDPVENARIWVRDVSAGRAIVSQTEHQVTVKYEDLLAPGACQLLRNLFGRMNLEVDDAFCQKALEECAIDRLRKQRDDLKSRGMAKVGGSDFFRKGEADSWRDELSVRDVEAIEYIAGDLMSEYGYTASTKFAARRGKPWRLKRNELLSSLKWRINRAALGFDKFQH